MIKLETYNIIGHDDFELNIKRKSKLTYHMAYDNTKESNGIVFVIPGFGEDGLVSYQQHLLKHIAEKYNFMAIFVEYHAIFARPNQDEKSASLKFGAKDTEILIQYLDILNVQLNENQLDYLSIVNKFNTHIEQLKLQQNLEKDYKLKMWGTMCPYKDEYQNFGVLQAIDILTVLYDIKKQGYEDIIKRKPIIAIGSSHGGYLANLIMKFAPNTFDLIIDNSCYVKPPMNYIVGFEMDRNKPEFRINYPHIDMYLFTLTNWSLEKNQYEFTQDTYNIRDLGNYNQLEQFLQYSPNTNIVSYHSQFDGIANYNDKYNYMQKLMNYNSSSLLYTINSSEQIDGSLIKNLNHAMGMSIKTLIDTYLSKINNFLPQKTKTNLCLKSNIEYIVSDTKKYIIKYNKNNITAKII